MLTSLDCSYGGCASDAYVGGYLVGVIVMYAIALAVGIWIYKRILNKAGYSAWWMLLMLVPIGNLVALILFAAKEWPIEAELRQARSLLLLTQSGGGGYGGAPQSRFGTPAPAPFGATPSYGGDPRFGSAPAQDAPPAYGTPAPYGATPYDAAPPYGAAPSYGATPPAGTIPMFGDATPAYGATPPPTGTPPYGSGFGAQPPTATTDSWAPPETPPRW